MFDVVSYIMGMSSGASAVEVSGSIVCTDDGEGNITVSVAEESDGE